MDPVLQREDHNTSPFSIAFWVVCAWQGAFATLAILQQSILGVSHAMDRMTAVTFQNSGLDSSRNAMGSWMVWCTSPTSLWRGKEVS